MQQQVYPAGHDEPRPATDGVAGVFDAQRRALTIGLVLAVTLVAFESLAVATILPAVKADLGGLRLYGWTFSAFFLASLIGITVAGEQCDSRGPAQPLLVGLALFGVGLVIAGTAPAMWVIVSGRAVQGVGAGMLPAVSMVSIGRGYPEHLRPRMFAIMSTAWVVPGLAGPGLAGVIAEYASWRLVFLGLLPLLIVAAWLILPPMRALGPPAEPALRERRVAGAVRLTFAAALMLAGLTMSSLLIGLPLAAAGFVLGLREWRALVPAGTLQAARGLPAAVAGMGLLNLAFFGADAFVPLIITDVRDQSVIVAGVVLTAATLAWTAGSWLQERTVLQRGYPLLAQGGLAMLIASIGLMMLVLMPGVPLLIAGVAWAGGGFAMGLSYPTFSLSVLSQSAQGREGADSASLKLNELLGTGIGTGIAGAVVAAGGSSVEPSALLAALALMAAVAAVGLPVAARIPPGGEPLQAEAVLAP